MTPEEARTLATKLCQTWPKALSATIWEEQLTPLNAGTAGTTYARLTRSNSTPTGPTIAEFHATYRSLDTSSPQHRPPCTHCDTSGWKPVTARIDGELHDIGVQPCHCPNGRHNDDTHAKVIAHNDTELARLGITRHTRKDAAA